MWKMDEWMNTWRYEIGVNKINLKKLNLGLGFGFVRMLLLLPFPSPSRIQIQLSYSYMCCANLPSSYSYFFLSIMFIFLYLISSKTKLCPYFFFLRSPYFLYLFLNQLCVSFKKKKNKSCLFRFLNDFLRQCSEYYKNLLKNIWFFLT